jgi:XTP/dITP diphosphohydrolase
MARPRLVVASFNRAKAREIAQIIASQGLDFEVVSLAEFPNATLPPETGATFAANATAKALDAARVTGLPAVADDSGLEVDALGGEPGIRSARYVEGGDEARFRKVLELMRDVPDGQRSARFRCAAAYATPAGETALAEGTCEGAIAREPAGSGGFGYDPILIPEGYTVTMAQLTPEQKHAISHRGKAFRALARIIQQERQ